MKIFTDDYSSLEPLDGKTIAILGYGNQGRAQALNLRDSGMQVVVGNQQDGYREQAVADGFEPMTIAEAATVADFLFILTTDESQPLIWEEQIAPGIEAGESDEEFRVRLQNYYCEAPDFDENFITPARC